MKTFCDFGAGLGGSMARSARWRGGIVAGRDYGGWPDVERAVKELLGKPGRVWVDKTREHLKG